MNKLYENGGNQGKQKIDLNKNDVLPKKVISGVRKKTPIPSRQELLDEIIILREKLEMAVEMIEDGVCPSVVHDKCSRDKDCVQCKLDFINNITTNKGKTSEQ
jgi:hypothetical protein